ncbi:MAG: tetratricopeptide repeat protein, partial [Cyanobacteriota bacterium]|nr:tetratricopeptide repeat protein [Cyanobacteriota bacterium]
GKPKEVARTLSRIGLAYINLAEDEPENQLSYQKNALEYYSQAILFYREINDFSNEAYTLKTIGEIYYELGEKQKALEAFLLAAKVFKDNGNLEKAINTLLQIAEDYEDFGDRKTALNFYNQAIPISQQLGDYKKEAFILRNIGQLYSELEEPNKAVEAFNQARKVYQKNSDYSGEAWTLYEIGKSYTTLGDFKKALNSYQKALPIYAQEKDAAWGEERTLDIFIRMSRIYAYIGDSENALEFCEKSLSYAQENFQAKTISNAEFFREIGKLCYRIGNPQKALDSFNQYGRFYQSLGVDREVTGFMRIGRDYTELGESKQALNFFNRARTVYQKSGFTEGEINTLVWISRIYFQSENYQNSIDYFNQGLGITRTINNQDKEALILAEIGESYAELGDREKALEFYNQALRLYQKLDNYRKQAEILNKIGEIYQQSENLEKALDYYQQALKVSQENSTFDLGSISRNIATLYSELGELESALKFFKQALNSNTEPSASLYIEMGKVYTNLGELEKALNFFDKSLEKVENKYPELRAENLFRIAIIERKQENLDTALTQIETAVSLIEKTRLGKISPEERLTFFASKQNYYEFYIDLLMELHQQNPSQGYDAQALNISERSKARSLLELLTEANTDIRKGVEPELVIQERSLQQQLDAVERRRVEIYNNENNTLEQRTAIEQERQYLLRKYEEVQTKIREKSPSYAALTQPQPLTLKQIQQQILDEDTLLLQYALGEKRSFLW